MFRRANGASGTSALSSDLSKGSANGRSGGAFGAVSVQAGTCGKMRDANRRASSYICCGGVTSISTSSATPWKFTHIAAICSARCACAARLSAACSARLATSSCAETLRAVASDDGWKKRCSGTENATEPSESPYANCRPPSVTRSARTRPTDTLKASATSSSLRVASSETVVA